ncbi:hypothetical protein E2E07_11695, partial [Staphylococcus pseudintermedius]|nr:hypothetical protein [Staphylococcus pseudintermedius]
LELLLIQLFSNDIKLKRAIKEVYSMSTFSFIDTIILVTLIPQTIKLVKILHLKKLGIKYVGNDNYEKTREKFK